MGCVRRRPRHRAMHQLCARATLLRGRRTRRQSGSVFTRSMSGRVQLHLRRGGALLGSDRSDNLRRRHQQPRHDRVLPTTGITVRRSMRGSEHQRALRCGNRRSVEDRTPTPRDCCARSRSHWSAASTSPAACACSRGFSPHPWPRTSPRQPTSGCRPPTPSDPETSPHRCSPCSDAPPWRLRRRRCVS